jgi:hypothetical protein
MRMLSVSAGQYFEVHGQDSGAAAQLALHADWSVAGSGSLLLGSLQLGGGSGSSGTHLIVAAGGQLTLQTVTMAGGTVTFSGNVTVTGSTLTSAHLSGTSGQLGLSGGTLTGSTVQLTQGTATFGGSCMLTNTPVSVSGATSPAQALLGVSQCELWGDGTAVLLTVGAAAMATVTQTTFRSTAGNITAVSVAAGGNLTVGSSQLVRADGHSDPFPCDGTLPHCTGAHTGLVRVNGPAAVTMASPLVCDVTTGTCLCDIFPFCSLPCCQLRRSRWAVPVETALADSARPWSSQLTTHALACCAHLTLATRLRCCRTVRLQPVRCTYTVPQRWPLCRRCYSSRVSLRLCFKSYIVRSKVRWPAGTRPIRLSRVVERDSL